MGKKFIPLMGLLATVMLTSPFDALGQISARVEKPKSLQEHPKALPADPLKDINPDQVIYAKSIDEAKKIAENRTSTKKKDLPSKSRAQSSMAHATVIGDQTVTTGPNIDVLPYSNALSSEDLFNEFGVIDVNGDDATWVFFSRDNAVAYDYSDENDGDDWLVSPAIRLEAGKIYTFSIDARAYSNYYPERFEVKMASEAKASILSEGTEIVPVTDITSEGFTTFLNDNIVVEESGYYHIGIHAISDADQYYLIVNNFVMKDGPDPSAPASVNDFTVTPLSDRLGATISFIAPTLTLGGGELGVSDIAKIEILRNDNVINVMETPVPGVQYTYIDDAEDLRIGNYRYQVITYGPNGMGGTSDVIEVFMNVAVDVPTSFDFSQRGIFENFVIIDANSDGASWKWIGDYGLPGYEYSSWNKADDHLISTGVKLKEGQMYKVTLKARCDDQTLPERFEVLVGKEASVEGLDIVAIPATLISNMFRMEEYSGGFIAPEDGVYYFSIHAISDPDMYRLMINSLTIEDGAEVSAPAAPEIQVVAAGEGVLKATVTITAPEYAINGEPLAGNIDKIELIRNEEVIATLYDVMPGEVKVYNDEDMPRGYYTYKAIAYVEDKMGLESEEVTVHIGQDLPSNVPNVQVFEAADSLTFTWDHIHGANGGYIEPENVVYSVTGVDIITQGFFQFFVEGETFASVTGETTVTFDYPVDAGQHGYKYFGVKAAIEEDESSPLADIKMVFVGAPYELPFYESFPDGALFHTWFWGSNATVDALYDASDEDGVALLIGTEDDNSNVSIKTGKLNLNTPYATLFFDAKSVTGNPDKITIYGVSPDEEKVEIETVTLTDEYQTYKVVIPETAKFDRWSQLEFMAFFESTEQYILYDNFRILDLYDNNLSVEVSCPAKLQTGETATVNAVVKNLGEKAAAGYTLIINAGEQELLNTTVSETLEKFAVAEFTAELATTIFDDGGKLPITATVIYAADEYLGDNTANTFITLVEPKVLGVSDVQAEITADGVELSWVAPTLDEVVAEEMTEDFEVDNGGWAFIDADGDGYNWRHQLNSENMDHILNTHNDSNGAVYSASWDNSAQLQLSPDNWMISPIAVLDGVFTFWATAQDENYHNEHFQVYVSTTSATDLSTFEPVSDEFIAEGSYKEYSVDLSEYAGVSGWIAIRHFNTFDEYELVVDDITYLTGVGISEIVNFNVYLDGSLIANIDADSYITTIENVPAGEHTIAVSVVYINGLESKPVQVQVNIDATSGIDTITLITQPVDIYSLDGKLIRKNATTLDGLKGIYVVGGKKVMIK